MGTIGRFYLKYQNYKLQIRPIYPVNAAFYGLLIVFQMSPTLYAVFYTRAGVCIYYILYTTSPPLMQPFNQKFVFRGLLVNNLL